MKKVGNTCWKLLLVIVLVSSLTQFCFASETLLPEAKLPLVATTCGQSPAALMFKVMGGRINLLCTQNDLLTKEDLISKAEEGEGYKTLIITTGTSTKGMGAAGTDMNAEVARINGLIQEARKQGMLIVGAHIEGMSRRVDSMDALSIETVMPIADVLIIKAASDEDGYFTKLSEEKNIPMIVFEQPLEIADVLKKLFNLE